MATVTVQSAAHLGIEPYSVHIEVDIQSGLPQFTVVGLPDASIKESRERVRSAIKNSGYRFPPDKITVNLAPANIKKEGPAYDLPIALGILAASEAFPSCKLKEYIFLGELALDGSLRPFKGAVVVAEGFAAKWPLVLPEASAHEAAICKKAVVYPAKSLAEVIGFLRGETGLTPVDTYVLPRHPPTDVPPLNFSDIKGQHQAKRALEIAAAGGHNILFIGSPGSGKTMLARRLPAILPPLSSEESLEITKICSVAGCGPKEGEVIRTRPFRNPHHSISGVAMAGGGSWPLPGEVSLAHTGLLFLDEFPEFRRDVIDVLRGPLEEGEVTISRAKMRVTYPSRFMLAAAMNPCPCGYLTDRRRACRCSNIQIQKYQTRISGPILDRIDLHVEMPALTYDALTGESPEESSESVRRRVIRCRAVQNARYCDGNSRVNALMKPKEIKQYARPDPRGSKLMEMAMNELNFSARAYYKILKVARTIADLAEVETISSEHIAEAIHYRRLDRQCWP